MKKLYLFTGMLLALAGHSQRWGLPRQDSSRGIISYTKGSQINSRHATIVYTKTVSAENLDPGAIRAYRAVRTITLTTHKESVTYMFSPPTVSVTTSAPGSGQAILSPDAAGNLRPIDVNTSGSSALVEGQLAQFSVSSAVLLFTISAASRASFSRANAHGQVPASFTQGGVTHPCRLNYQVSADSSTVSFGLERIYIPQALPPPSMTDIQSLEPTPTPTASLGTAPTSVIQLTVSVRSYTLVAAGTETVNLTMQERRNLYENYLFRAKHNAGIFYLSGGFMPSILGRQVLINRPSYRNSQFINHTKYNESPSYDVDVFGKMGLRLRRKAILFVEATYGIRGFRTDYDSINPFSGVADHALLSKEYKAYVLSLGVGYSYNWYIPGRFVNPVVEACFYASRDQNTIYTSPNIRQTRAGIKLGAGIALKPNIRHDIKIMPVFCYDFTAIVKNDVSTRFYAVGLNLSYGIALFNYGK